jgi:hypothetical protein
MSENGVCNASTKLTFKHGAMKAVDFRFIVLGDIWYLRLLTINFEVSQNAIPNILYIMNLEHYQFRTNSGYLDFEFDSEGPNGAIRKVVRFSPQNANGITYFNLGFGDLDPKTGRISDLSKSNNGDREKILSTIAHIVLVFTAHFPDVMVYAQGSTAARTRLYQMGIANNLDEIQDILNVYGYSNDTWQRFERQVNYEAFLVARK